MVPVTRGTGVYREGMRCKVREELHTRRGEGSDRKKRLIREQENVKVERKTIVHGKGTMCIKGEEPRMGSRGNGNIKKKKQKTCWEEKV